MHKKISNELPILSYKTTILTEIHTQDITMISASTGSGKSSQVPQWLIDLDPKNRVIVTQPRRLSTVRICAWVSRCRGEQVGSSVGYRIGHGSAKVSPQTRLTFCTAGYLTERLLHQPKFLTKFKYICLDEVHERSLEMDLLLKMVKEHQSKFDYKIVLMSATLNAHILQDYFDVNRRPVEIETQLYPVDVYYTDTVHEILPPTLPNDIKQSLQYVTLCNIESRCYGAIGRHQIHLVVYLIRTLAKKGHSTLVFLSGISLINDVAHRIHEWRSPQFRVIILHSSIDIADDDVVPDPTKFNIFLASDVAESSITLDLCDLVIDLCISREIVVENGRQILKSVWSSQDSVKQRKGRTGRVMKGICVRIIPESLHDELSPNGDPEILKMLPTELAYRLKTSVNSSIIPLTKELPTIPYEDDIRDAIEKLHEWGILTDCDDESANLTPMGKQMSKIPLDLRGSQMVITSVSLGIAYDVIILAALRSIDQDPFAMPHPLRHPDPVNYAQEIRRVVNVKRMYDKGCLSEAFVYIGLFRAFRREYDRGIRGYQLSKWCQKNCVYRQRMTLWAHIVKRVASSIPDNFVGRDWLIGNMPRGPERVDILFLRLFILLFGEVHDFSWSGKGKLVFANVPEVLEDKEKLRFCLGQLLGHEVHFADFTPPSQKSGCAKKIRLTTDVTTYIDLLPLTRMKNGKPYIHLPIHPSEKKSLSSELERKIQSNFQNFHPVQLAVPSPIVNKSNLVIVERTFPWINHEKSNLTYSAARYVRNVTFPSGVTVLKDINVEKWQTIKDPNENKEWPRTLRTRLNRVQTSAVPDIDFLHHLLHYLYETTDMRRRREEQERRRLQSQRPDLDRNATREMSSRKEFV